MKKPSITISLNGFLPFGHFFSWIFIGKFFFGQVFPITVMAITSKLSGTPKLAHALSKLNHCMLWAAFPP